MQFSHFYFVMNMVTHDLGVVGEICDDVFVMYSGRMVEYAPADAVFEHSVHPYTRRLLAAFPDIRNPNAELASIPGHPPSLDNLPPGCRFEPRCGMGGAGCVREIPGVVEVGPGHLCSCLQAKPIERSND